MVALIDEHRAEYEVEPICRVLPTAPSTYYAFKAVEADPTKASTRAQQDELLKPEIWRVFEQNFNLYGARKVWLQLNREGIRMARCTVERLITERLALAGIEPSVGSHGDSYDNALAETIIGLYKTELIELRGPWTRFEDVELATLEWVWWFNNHLAWFLAGWEELRSGSGDSRQLSPCDTIALPAPR